LNVHKAPSIIAIFYVTRLGRYLNMINCTRESIQCILNLVNVNG